MLKSHYYTLFERLHLMRKELTKDPVKDLETYRKHHTIINDNNKTTPMYFATALNIFNDLHVYDVDIDAHNMVETTLLKDVPTRLPQLLSHPFLLSTAKPIIADYNLIAYTPEANGQYSIQAYSYDEKMASILLAGLAADIPHLTKFNITDYAQPHEIRPNIDPNDMKTALFKYISTFAVLLEAERTPLEIEGKPHKIKNHLAAKHGVKKTLWSTQYVYLNANVKHLYEQHTAMDKSGKVQLPTITRAHIRTIHTDHGEKQIFVASYVSDRWITQKLSKTRVKTYNTFDK